ncbi:MAG: pilin, partial [Patescibacteria group bacterium]
DIVIGATNTATPGPGPTNSSGPGPTGRPISFNFKFDNPLGGGEQNLLDLINTISRWIFNLAIPIAVIFIIYGGILFLTAGANPTNVDEGKKILKYAVIGLAIVFIGRGFVSLVHSVIKLGDTTTATPTTQPR